ncbi:MAG: hypothetical protein JXL81_06765 [Deltaproteobacteria bacterium]|nr:hypothetical protein [Deltaproteobacteria bacterium]
MNTDQPDFQSLRNIRDNTLLITIAKEYLSENIFLKKIGSEIKKNLSALRDDIVALKKQFPGKFTQEVDTDSIMNSFESTTHEMLSGGDELKKNCISGKLGVTLNSDVVKITEAIEKIWHQVKGSDIKYTATDSISGFFDRLNVFSAIARLFSRFIRIIILIFIILIAGFFYLFFTMEKEAPILADNKVLITFIDEKKVVLNELERKKSDAQKKLKALESGKLQRKDKIAILDIETQIQGLNQEIHAVEGLINIRMQALDENNKKLEILEKKSFLDKLFRL